MAVYIIGEAGVNHNGNLKTALELVDAAKQAGCDCVKFQTFKADKIVTKQAGKAEYQIENTNNTQSQYEMLKSLELEDEEFALIKNHCDEVEIDFLSTPFDEDAAKMLENLNMSQYKIPSGELTNKPLISYIARKHKPMLVSTGMADLKEVEECVQWIVKEGNKDITLFHCTSNYPAPYDTVNMRAMITLKETFKLPVGYSDHTRGIEIPVMAVSMGAVAIEKHFTLSRDMPGPDHKASLEPGELSKMVAAIRHVEEAFGDGVKKPSPEEMKTRIAARKSLVYTKDLQAGHMLTKEDLTTKRPGSGIPPKELDYIIGKVLKINCSEDTLADKSHWGE